VQFHDRCAVCTARWPTTRLSDHRRTGARAAAHSRDRIFEQRVFFIRNLGFITPTKARRISFAEALRFEQVHEATYLRLGYQLVRSPPARSPIGRGDQGGAGLTIPYCMVWFGSAGDLSCRHS